MTSPDRADTFFYDHPVVDTSARTITCHYRSDGVAFTEVATFDDTVELSDLHGLELGYFLLAGLSYYKTGAARTVDLGDWFDDANSELVTQAIRGGLGEFAYRNNLDLSDVELTGTLRERRGAASPESKGGGPLIPFGGGIDSIVTAATATDDAALFIVSPGGDSFAAIEQPASRTGRTVVRCSRRLDSALFESQERGWLNGHVPVTGILSALAVIAAWGQGRASVIMSNERSASSPNLVANGRDVNHQWSKSWEFEELLRSWLHDRVGGALSYYSALRDRSELWVAREFMALPEYFDSFMSCNRAFRQDEATRAATWCGQCDKCLFIDLILSPFASRSQLEALFGGHEPITDPAKVHDLEVLVGLAANPKPFECVGDVDECATALVATAARGDRADQPALAALAARCPGARPLEALLKPHGPTNAPERDAARDLV
ncbi:MAG TPA: hypothetical protein VIE15_06955 [Acidimicrobiales bacterium]